jgi:hypothetical protein
MQSSDSSKSTTPRSPSEHARNIKAAIEAAKRDGCLLVFEGSEFESQHVTLVLAVNQRQPEGWMKRVRAGYRGRVDVMGSREDDDYWNVKYAEAHECEIHGDTQYHNSELGEYECYECIDEEDMQNG